MGALVRIEEKSWEDNLSPPSSCTVTGNFLFSEAELLAMNNFYNLSWNEANPEFFRIKNLCELAQKILPRTDPKEICLLRASVESCSLSEEEEFIILFSLYEKKIPCGKFCQKCRGREKNGNSKEKEKVKTA